MAEVEGPQGQGGNANDGDVPILLDEHRDEDQLSESLLAEIQHKLTAGRHHHHHGKGSTSRSKPGSRIVNEEQEGSGKNSKSRLEELFTISPSAAANKDESSSRSPTAATFKPIKLAVAKARTTATPVNTINAKTTISPALLDNNERDDTGADADNTTSAAAAAATANDARIRRTTTVLPGSGAAPGTDDAVGDDDDVDDAASYVEMGRAFSETASSSGESMTKVRDQDRSIFDWLQNTAEKKTRPFRSRTATATGDFSVANPVKNGQGASTSMSIARSKAGSSASEGQRGIRRSRKGSRVSSQGDQDLVTAAESVQPERQRSGSVDLLGVPAKRSDTFRQKVLGRTSSNFRVSDADGSGKRQIPFFASRRRRRRRKKKGKNGTVSSDSDSDSLLDDEDLFHETLLRAGLLDKDVPQQMVTEAMFENQRGIFLLGARYAKNALVPGDPAPWTDLHGNVTGYNIANYPLPTPAWRWYHTEWLVSMMGDVDSEGFQYSTRFSSKFWRGIPEIRFFVRRRLWIRTRYRPVMKAQTIAQSTRTPRGHLTSLQENTNAAGQATLAIAPALQHRRSRLFVPTLAMHLDMYNPFISWYEIKREVANAETDGAAKDPESSTTFKQDVIHANFVRVAKVLVRRMGMDRRRLAWWEYWLGARNAPMRVAEASVKDLERGTGKERILHQIDEHANLQPSDKQRHADQSEKPRPDIRDVWDLLEDRLDDVLGLFEYHESRRQLLLLLQGLHNSSHVDHHYQNRSNSPESPLELDFAHMHGRSDEMGNSAAVRAENGDGTHSASVRRPRLKFGLGLELDRRLREMQIPLTTLQVENQTS